MPKSWLHSCLHNCNFSGPIPRQIFNLTQLSWLYLHSNSFTGTVELSSFQELPALYNLSLSKNRLSGIDGEFTSSREMGSLSLACCNISSFPIFLRNINMVNYLDLSDNKIHSALPHWAWEKWDNMIVFNLSHNQIHCSVFRGDIPLLDISSNLMDGPLPIPGPNMYLFDCSNNRFSSIPLNFGSRLSNISFIRASRNNLSGEIPPSICDARGLTLLDLSYNNLSGLIPSCL